MVMKEIIKIFTLVILIILVLVLLLQITLTMYSKEIAWFVWGKGEIRLTEDRKKALCEHFEIRIPEQGRFLYGYSTGGFERTYVYVFAFDYPKEYDAEYCGQYICEQLGLSDEYNYRTYPVTPDSYWMLDALTQKGYPFTHEVAYNKHFSEIWYYVENETLYVALIYSIP